MNGRRFILLGIVLLSLVCAGPVFAGGAYQRTDDRKKTLVWNNDPQPGDAAEWSGGRDSEGYADGPGTLKWFRVQRSFATGSNLATGRRATPISAYTGNMVHGKFEGSVVTVDHGKTYHATFADGQRKGRWAPGTAIAKAEKVQAETPSEEGADAVSAEKSAAAAEKIESPEKKTAEPETAAPAEGPVAETKSEPPKAKPEPSKIDSRLAKTETTSTVVSADQLEESPTPQKPVTKKAALAPGAVRAIDKPGRATEKAPEQPKEPKIKRATKVEAPKIEPAETPAEGPPQIPTRAPSQPTKEAKPARPSAQQTPADDSIRNLTGPPTSLRAKSKPETAAPPLPESAPSIAPVAPPSAPAAPKLNTVQAMDIADIEARTRGYDLGEYQLPKAEYNAADDTWSVSYAPREADKSAKRLNVTVQDKSGKAEVKK